MWTNYSNRFDLLERKDILIFQEDNRFTRRLTEDLTMFWVVIRTFRVNLRLIKKPCFLEHTEQSPNFVVECFFCQGTIIQRALDVFLRHPTRGAWHFEIKPSVRNFAIISSEPVRDHNAFIA